jgi:hypothetical protein
VVETEWQKQYRADGLILAEIGSAVAQIELPQVRVRLARLIAERAVAAWKRDDDTGPLGPEDYEQRVLRR